jgi:hypothetical protein
MRNHGRIPLNAQRDLLTWVSRMLRDSLIEKFQRDTPAAYISDLGLPLTKWVYSSENALVLSPTSSEITFFVSGPCPTPRNHLD